MTAPWHLTAAEMDAAWDDLTARLAEAEALLMELNQRPRHFEGGVYWLRTYTGDYERIARIVAPDSASVVQENSR